MALVDGTNCGFVTVAPSADPASGTVGQVSGYAIASRFDSPAGATTITEIGWWCDTATQEANFEVGVYDNDGSPNNLIGSDITNAKGTTAGWKKATGLSISISGSTTYWLAVQLDTTATATYFDHSTDVAYAREYVAASTLPNPWSGTNGGSRFYAIYAVYTDTTTYSLTGTIASASAVSGAAGKTTITPDSLAGTIASASSVSGAVGKTTITPLGLAGTITSASSMSGAAAKLSGLSLTGIIVSTSSVTGYITRRQTSATYPQARPSTYDADKVYNEDTGTWGSDETRLREGGSRYRTQLIAIAKDLVYYEERT